MKKWYVLILLGGLLLPSISPAIDLKQSKFTQVVNNVEIISADHTRHTAAVNDIFSMPDVLRTGPDSRAELDAVDGTITRVGANTIFSFDPLNRTIDLQQGSLLFHSPKGKGGGTIRTGSATASVIGTTIIITATQNGGFKLLDLEGQAEVRFLNGINQTLEPGQMTFILPSGQTSPILVFRLDSETKGSTLVSGFNTPLDSQSKINSEITQQLLQILNGTAADTGLLVGDNATPTTVQVVQSINNSSPPSQPSSTPPPPIFSTDGSIVGSDHVNNLVDANDKPLLPKNYSPLDPAHTFDGSITPLTSADIAGINSIDSFSQGLSFLGLTDPASGFFGNNIDIDTANVDLSSFAAKSDFDIMAKGDLRIWQSVNFTPGFSSPSVTSLDSGQPAVISLIAGGQMLIASGSTLEADTTTFGLVAGGFGTLDTSTGLADSDYPDALENLHIVNNDGAIQILSLSDFTLEDYSTIYAGNDGTGLGLEIESDGNLTLGYNGYSLLSGPSWNVLIHSAGDVDLTAGGKIGIYDTEVNATGGDIKITAGGNVDIENSYLPASSPESLLAAPAPGATGSVIITGAGVDVEYTSISAGGDVGIEGSGTLYLGWNRGGDEISAGSSVSLTSDNGDVDVSEYDIYADGSDENGNGINISAGGNVDVEDSSEIYAFDGGVSISGDDSVYLYNDDIEAGEDTDGLYDLDVISYGSTVDIDDTYLYASGSVNIESGDTLTIEDDADIKAYDGAVSLKSDNADVDITDSDVYADNGAVNINAGGNVYLSSSDIESGYNSGTYAVDINAAGTIDLEGTYVYATGDLNIESGGTLTLGQNSSDTVEAAGNVNLTSDNADVDSYGYDVYADYGAVSINAGGNVYLSDSDIESGWDTSTAYDVDINAGGTIDLEDAYVYATGDLNIESGGTLTLGQSSSDTVEATGNVNLTSDNADVDSYGYDLYSDYGAVNINAGGNVDIEGGEIYAYDDVTIASSTGFAPSSCGRGNVDINDAEIYAGYDVSYDEIPSSYDGGSVTIDAWKGHVDLYDDDIEAYSGEYSDGHMTIYANGSVDVDDTELYADGDVNIESANTLTVEDSSEIDSYGLAGISLTSDNADVDVYDSEFYAYNGSVNVGASGNVNIENSDIYAFDNVNITSSTGSAPAPDAFSPAPGSVDIEYSYIYAGYNNTPDEISDSTDGGSVNITAWSGDVDLYDDEIYAYSGLNIGTGDVNIYASGSVDLDDVYRLYADDSIEIEGVNTVTVEDGSDLDAYNGDVSLTSDNADVDITDSEIYSDYGNVNIKAAGSVYMSDGNIQAGYYSDTIGDVVINAHNGTADFENTDIEAAGGVYIESSGTLTLNYTAPSDDVDNNSEIYAGGGLVSLKSDYGNVDIYNYDVNAEGGDLDINAGGGPSLTCSDNSGGNVDIENTDFQVSGSAYVNATGNVYVDNSYFDMYEGGDVNVNAGGNIDVLYTDGSSGSGSVNLTAGGYVNVYDYALNMGSFDVTAGTYADFGADQSVEIYGSTIAANGGDVNITGNSAGVDIDSTTITGTGDINITAGGGYHVDSLSSGGHVAPAYVAPSAAAGAFVALGTFTPETFVEPAPISAASDYIDENGADIEDAGTLDLEANIDANIQNNSSLVSDSGNVMVNSGGTEEVDSSYIDANGSVYLTAVGSVSLSDSLASSDIYSDIYADNGDVDIQSSGSTVDIEKTYIYAHGSVNIESSDTLTLGYNGGNTIEVYDGDVSLTSDNADVDAYNYSIYSDYGNVNISAGGNVFLSDDYIYSGYDTDAGNVNIQSLAGSVDIEGTYISAAGNVGIISYGTLTLGNTSGYEIYADGWANLSSTTGDVDINGYRIYTYGSDVDGNGLTISAAVGSLNISGDSFSAYDNGDVNMSALGADSTVDINDTYIYAGGDVNIESSGTLTVENSSTIESYGNNGISLKSDLAAVDLNDSSLYAYNGDVNIAAPGVSGTIDLEDTYISAFGNVNIESSGTLTLGSVSAWTIDAGNAISLKSDNADVDIYNDYEIDADGSDINGNGITISAGGNVDIENDGDIYADYGGVKIAAAGSVYLYDDEIYAGYDDTDYGNMNITSSGSTVDVDNTYLNAEGDVSVESSDMLTVENSSEIDSYGYNGISLTSDNADVDVNDSSLYAYYGNVNITAIATSAEIDLQSDDISAYGNVNIESDGTLTMGNSETGGDTIYAGSGIYLSSNNGDVDVYNSTIDGGFANNNDGFNGIVNDITIHDGSTITADTAVNLNAYGATVSIYAPYGNIYIGDTTINPGGGIGITDSTITANGHDINGNGVSIYSDGYFYVGGRSDTLFNDDIEGNNISIDGSAITANNGGISIVNDAYASTADAIGFNIDNTTLIYGDINISSGSTITADDGSINISTASLKLFNASSAYSSDISLNDISIYDSTIEAIGGNVTVSAGGYLTTGTEIVSPDKRGISAALLAPYAVSINASGDISLYGYSGVDLDVTTAEAGGKLDLESDNYVDVYNSSLTSDTGHLDIYGDYGNVDVEYSTIKATLGNVDIEAGYDDFTYDYNNETLTLFGDTITAGGSVTLSTPGGVGILDVSTVGMTVDDVGITADSISLLTHYHAIDLDVNDFGSSTLTARTGDADIYADNGDVDVQGSTIKATLGNVNIGAGFTDVNNYNVEQLTLNGVTITAGEAASLTSSGGIHVDDSDITAASITLETLYGVANLDVNDFGSSTLTAGTGDADIYADNGKVDIEGSTINATLGNVNIGAGYTDDPDYNSETLTLNGGSIIAGEAVTLTAQSDVDVNVDNSDTTTLTAGSGDVSVTSYYGNVDVENSTVTAGGSVTLTAPGTVTLNNGSLTGNNSITYGVNVNAGTGITINGTAITADDPTYGIYLTSSAGMTTIQNGASMTGNLTINSPDGILIDGSHGGTISGSTMNLTAGGGDILGGPAINVNNEDFSTFQTVNMSAHTINLTDVAFGGSSIVNLHSFLGLLALFPNTGAASVPGEVNFITGVTYGGVAAQLRIGSGINISGL